MIGKKYLKRFLTILTLMVIHYTIASCLGNGSIDVDEILNILAKFEGVLPQSYA